MKPIILLPTDFSNNSIVAMKYAQGLANYLNADIHILHAYKAFVTAFQSKIVNEADAYRAKYEAEVDMKKFLAKFTEQEINIFTTSIIEGNLVDVIQNYESINPLTLIIMGTHGSSVPRKNILGSNSYDIAKNTNTPLLIVPENNKGFKMDKLIFFTDYQNQDNKVFEIFKYIFKPKNIICTMVHITHERYNEEYKKLKDWVNSLSKTNNMQLESKLVLNQEKINVVNEIIEELQADLCLLTLIERRNFFERLFSKSLARKIILNPKVPILLNLG
ncbi:universal stress protein [Empedobacter sp. UBA7248]|uniref:universal stress protein n=1 Tax=Empedobacter sp. UBA7248 TaxID=1946448 RepID=UPI0025C4D90A|nr:universal stress protein [Empedobacter sp. UBA7248]